MRVSKVGRMRAARSDTSSLAEEMSLMTMVATARACEETGGGFMDLGDDQGSATGG